MTTTYFTGAAVAFILLLVCLLFQKHYLNIDLDVHEWTWREWLLLAAVTVFSWIGALIVIFVISDNIHIWLNRKKR